MFKKVLLVAMISLIPQLALASQKGCCSRHQGVNQCGVTGYYVCKDGTTSPTCKCDAPATPNKEIVKPNESPMTKELLKQREMGQPNPHLNPGLNNDPLKK